MADWSMTVQVTGEGDGAVSFRAVHADDAAATADAATDPAAGVVTARSYERPADDGDRVDALAAALTSLLDRVGRTTPPVRLGVVVDGEADRREFLELDEAAALAGLPAPTWVPEPIAVAGHRLAARLEPGDAAVVLDARGTTLTAWPLERSDGGVVVAARGPVAVTDRIDELLVGVVRATGRSTAGQGDGGPGGRVPPDPPSGHGPAALRRAGAERRREVRRARRRLAAIPDGGPDEGTPGGRGAQDRDVLDVAVFEQAVTSALGEVMDALAGDRRVAVEVVAGGPSVLARAICDLIGAQPVVPASSDAAVLGAAGLVLGLSYDDEPFGDEDHPEEDRTEEGPAGGDGLGEDRAGEDGTDRPSAGDGPVDRGTDPGAAPGGPEPDESPTSEDVFDGPSPVRSAGTSGSGSTPGGGTARSWAVGSLGVSIVLAVAAAVLLLVGGSATETSGPVAGGGIVAPG